ncbi:MAG: aa3-type cytochrome c oxidase subunit IV [Paracoccaceae bacterium]|nr:aa3-type cytochrome c oxidase subunit IV [Paracoccaceae bacterium]
MLDHKHGEMDITEHQRVFSGFIKFGIYVGLFSVFVLVFLALFNS